MLVRTTRLVVAAAALGTVGAGVLVTVAAADDDDDDRRIEVHLSGYHEDPPVSTEASGEFRMKVDRDDEEITYRLEYEDLEGTVTQAHIHFGNRFSTGGVSAWLCETATAPSPVASTPTCPQSGSVTGTITAAEVVGPTAQGISAGEFDELVDAIRAQRTYVNVHSSAFPGGEIRSQLKHHD
jgi:hypothetical protein